MFSPICSRYAATPKSARSYATRVYGDLKDKDRIFTNLYMDGSPFLEDALKRVHFPLHSRVMVGHR